jgi:hypothetical protein
MKHAAACQLQQGTALTCHGTNRSSDTHPIIAWQLPHGLYNCT